jgi:hypothetical protein
MKTSVGGSCSFWPNEEGLLHRRTTREWEKRIPNPAAIPDISYVN